MRRKPGPLAGPAVRWHTTEMRNTVIACAMAALPAMGLTYAVQAQSPAAPKVVVYKSPT